MTLARRYALIAGWVCVYWGKRMRLLQVGYAHFAGFSQSLISCARFIAVVQNSPFIILDVIPYSFLYSFKLASPSGMVCVLWASGTAKVCVLWAINSLRYAFYEVWKARYLFDRGYSAVVYSGERPKNILYDMRFIGRKSSKAGKNIDIFRGKFLFPAVYTYFPGRHGSYAVYLVCRAVSLYLQYPHTF